MGTMCGGCERSSGSTIGLYVFQLNAGAYTPDNYQKSRRNQSDLSPQAITNQSYKYLSNDSTYE